jgi:hypothetical protein
MNGFASAAFGLAQVIRVVVDEGHQGLVDQFTDMAEPDARKLAAWVRDVVMAMRGRKGALMVARFLEEGEFLLGHAVGMDELCWPAPETSVPSSGR